MDGNGEGVVCEVDKNDKGSFLHLVSFTNGELKKSQDAGLNITMYKNDMKNQNKTSKKVILVESNRMQYSSAGLDYLSMQRAFFSKYQVCVLNKKRGMMKFYGTNIVDCRPVLDSSAAEDAKVDETYSEKLDSLTNAFGSKKKKKAAHSRLKNKTNEEVMNFALTNAMEKSDTSRVERVKVVNDSIPPQNPTAVSPGEIYNVWDIISHEEYSALDQEIQKIRQIDSKEIILETGNNKYCYYATQLLNYYKQRVDDHKLKLLLYFNYLIKVLNTGFKELRTKDPMPDIPEPLKENLSRKFIVISKDASGKEQRSIPPRMKDKIMIYCTVLALINGNFTVSFGMLQRDFKTATAKLTRIAHSLGCHVSNKKHNGMEVKSMELKIPLFVPYERARKRKK